MSIARRKVHAVFETERFWSDLDRVRQERKLTWHQLTIATGINSIKTRAARRDNPRIDTLVPIATWAGLSLDGYIKAFDPSGNTKTLAPEPRFQPDDRREPGYDLIRFYADLDQVRLGRGLSWPDVRRQVRSTTLPLGLSTFMTGHIPLDRRLCEALARWARLDFSVYLPGEVQHV